jgi:hypothetical protein
MLTEIAPTGTFTFLFTDIRLIGFWRDSGRMAAVANVLESFAYVAQAEHNPERAARLLGAAEALRDNIRVPLTADERREFDAAAADLRGQMEAGAFAAAWAQGRAMDTERAIQFAVTAADGKGPGSEP